MSRLLKQAYALELARICQSKGILPTWLIKQAAKRKTREELQREQEEALRRFEEQQRKALEDFQRMQQQQTADYETQVKKDKEDSARRREEWQREQDEFNKRLDEQMAAEGPKPVSRDKYQRDVAELVAQREELEKRIRTLEADQLVALNPGASEKLKDYERMQQENGSLRENASAAERAQMAAEDAARAAQKDLSTEQGLHAATRSELDTTRKTLSDTTSERDKLHADNARTAKELKSTQDAYSSYKNRPWHQDITGGLSKGWTGLKNWASNNKPLSVAGGAALAGGLGYYLYNKIKKNRAKKRAKERLLSALSE